MGQGDRLPWKATGRDVPREMQEFSLPVVFSTKVPDLESSDELRRRIDAASAFVPIERLALSPQCGFASDFRGNPITEDDQWRKLELLASVAEVVWGGVGSNAFH
jgi:5-methyltetrahydropteroyltriglutamate--homocysteine methyltransferase